MAVVAHHGDAAPLPSSPLPQFVSWNSSTMTSGTARGSPKSTRTLAENRRVSTMSPKSKAPTGGSSGIWHNMRPIPGGACAPRSRIPRPRPGAHSPRFRYISGSPSSGREYATATPNLTGSQRPIVVERQFRDPALEAKSQASVSVTRRNWLGRPISEPAILQQTWQTHGRWNQNHRRRSAGRGSWGAVFHLPAAFSVKVRARIWSVVSPRSSRRA